MAPRVLGLWLAWASAAPIVPVAERELEVLTLQEQRLDLSKRAQGGFQGPAREFEVFEAALEAHLLGDPADAAMGFYVYLHMGATHEDLILDAEWYLAVALERMELDAFAGERFEAMSLDPSHPFRSDALAALLAIEARGPRPERFRAVYRRARAQGTLTPSPALTYALGKAQYDLGALPEATVDLDGVPEGSSHGIRARYLLGVILLRQGDLAGAESVFRDLSTTPAANRAEEHARDLATLAVARLRFHVEDFDGAGYWYGRVGRSDAVLKEAVVETLWNHVALEDWGTALLSFGWFDEQYPNHPDWTRMRLLEGHVLYRLGRTKDAGVAYDRVAFLGASIVSRMQALDLATPRHYGLLHQPDQWLPGRGLPPEWTLRRLADHPEFKRAFTARRGQVWAEDQLRLCDDLLRQLDDAFASPVALGRFQLFRQSADAEYDALEALQIEIHLDELTLREAEGTIDRETGRGIRGQLEAFRDVVIDRRAARATRFTDVSSLLSDRLQIREQLARMESEVQRKQLTVVDAELQRLEVLREQPPEDPELTLRVREAAAPLATVDADRVAYVVLHDLIDQERERQVVLRRQLDADAVAARGPLEAVWSVERERVAQLKIELANASTRVEDVWAHFSEVGRESVIAQVNDDLMEAESGLGDIVWNDLLDIRDRIEQVQLEQQDAGRRLTELFDLLRARDQ